MSAEGGDGGFTEPGWFGRAAALFTAGSATAAGVSLWENPAAWVLAVVSEFVVEGVLSLGRELGELVVLVNNQIGGALGDVGGAILSGFGVLGGAVLSVYGIYDSVVATLARAAGPFSFLVVIASIALAMVVGALLTTLILRAVVVIT